MLKLASILRTLRKFSALSALKNRGYYTSTTASLPG